MRKGGRKVNRIYRESSTHTVMLIQEWASIASNVGAERRRAGLQRDVSGHGPGCLGAGATGGAPSNGVPSEDVAPMHQVARMTASLPPTPTGVPVAGESRSRSMIRRLTVKMRIQQTDGHRYMSLSRPSAGADFLHMLERAATAVLSWSPCR